MKTHGHSGSGIQLVDNKIVKSSTGSAAYRLMRQAIKQGDFDESKYMYIKTPKIISMHYSASGEKAGIIQMDYIDGLSVYDEIKTQLDAVDFAKKVTRFIDDEINYSQMMEISSIVFAKKWASVKEGINKNPHISDEDKLKLSQRCDNIFYEKLPVTMKLPIGVCHGDLTYANMIFKEDDIYLVDFLDTFVESPLQDIVKFRQDSCYNWTSYVTEGNPSLKTEYKNIIDDNIINHYCGCNWYINYYSIFQLMNLLRILPYASDSKIITMFIQHIYNLSYIIK